jgi:hypothetical protein
VLLEKNGRCVALVDEPLALSGSEDLVKDIVDRLSSLGWRPLVAWRDAPRIPWMRMRYRCLGKTPSASLLKGLIFRARLFDRKKAQ